MFGEWFGMVVEIPQIEKRCEDWNVMVRICFDMQSKFNKLRSDVKIEMTCFGDHLAWSTWWRKISRLRSDVKIKMSWCGGHLTWWRKNNRWIEVISSISRTMKVICMPPTIPNYYIWSIIWPVSWSNFGAHCVFSHASTPFPEIAM